MPHFAVPTVKPPTSRWGCLVSVWLICLSNLSEAGTCVFCQEPVGNRNICVVFTKLPPKLAASTFTPPSQTTRPNSHTADFELHVKMGAQMYNVFGKQVGSHYVRLFPFLSPLPLLFWDGQSLTSGRLFLCLNSSLLVLSRPCLAVSSFPPGVAARLPPPPPQLSLPALTRPISSSAPLRVYIAPSEQLLTSLQEVPRGAGQGRPRLREALRWTSKRVWGLQCRADVLSRVHI